MNRNAQTRRGSIRVLLLLLILTATITVLYIFIDPLRSEAKASEKQRIPASLQNDFEYFAKSYAPEQQACIKTLLKQEEQLALKTASLVATLNKLKKDPAHDVVFIKVNNAWTTVRTARERIQKELEETYLMYHQSSSTSKTEKDIALEQRLSQGNAAARETQEHCTALAGGILH